MDMSYRTEVTSNLDDLEKLRPIWSSMQSHPNTDLDFYLSILKSRSNVLRPHIVVLYKDSDPIAIMVARLEHNTIDCKIGYFSLCKIPVRSLTVLHGGFLGHVTDIEAEEFVAHCLRVLEQGDADVVHFHNLHFDSDILLNIKRMTRVFLRDMITPTRNHWVMDLPRRVEDFWKEIRLKHRNLIPNKRRREKMLNKDFGAKVEYREFRESIDVEQLCRDAEEVTRKTYQRGLGVGFLDNMENRQRLSLEALRRSLRGYILYVNEKPVSFWMGSICGDTLFVSFLGYDPALAKYSPGTLIFVYMIEKLCAENIRHVDFGVGDAFYKERFGDTCWLETSILIFAPRLRCVGLNLFRTLTLALDCAGRFIVSYLNMFQKIKTFWRKRLIKIQPEYKT